MPPPLFGGKDALGRMGWGRRKNPAYGFQHRVISIRTSRLYVLDVERDSAGALETLREEARRARQEDDALAILLGCAGFAKFAEELEQELGIPVLDGVVCAVKMAEGVVELGKKTSKAKTYRPPESKSFTGMFERFGSRSPKLQKKAG